MNSADIIPATTSGTVPGLERQGETRAPSSGGGGGAAGVPRERHLEEECLSAGLGEHAGCTSTLEGKSGRTSQRK